MAAVKHGAVMELIPAIDLRGGNVVRLRQGDFARESSYGSDPVATARRWAEEGAKRLHLVDLDGARAGHPVQLEVVGRIVAAVSIPCQIGGGIRTHDDVRRMLALGADRAILGTALLGDPSMSAQLVDEHGVDRIVAAIDMRGGEAVGLAWAAGSAGQDAMIALERLYGSGVRWFAVTSIQRDGMLTGPDLPTLMGIHDAFPEARLIASGGIASVDDLRSLADAGMAAAILGRALYEGRIDMTAALAAL